MRIVSCIVVVLSILSSSSSVASQVLNSNCDSECANRVAEFQISKKEVFYELEQRIHDLVAKRDEGQIKLESCERVQAADAAITRQLEEAVAVEQQQVDAMKNVGDIVLSLESTIQTKRMEVDVIQNDIQTIMANAETNAIKNREDVAALKTSFTLAGVSASALEKEIAARKGSYFNVKKF